MKEKEEIVSGLILELEVILHFQGSVLGFAAEWRVPKLSLASYTAIGHSVEPVESFDYLYLLVHLDFGAIIFLIF